MKHAACVIVTGVLVMGGIAAPVLAQSLRSPALATELTDLLTQRGLDAVATIDPDAPDRFIAALAFPKVQLLVVSAKYPVPTLLQQQIAAKSYRDAYMALQQSGIAEGKLFVHDLKADGLRRADGEGVDVVYEEVVKQTVFDGAPEKHSSPKRHTTRNSKPATRSTATC